MKIYNFIFNETHSAYLLWNKGYKYIYLDKTEVVQFMKFWYIIWKNELNSMRNALRLTRDELEDCRFERDES